MATRKQTVLDLPTATFRLKIDDQKIMDILRRKLGVDSTQVFRLAIRALASKEKVAP